MRRCFANCKVPYKHAILSSLSSRKGGSGHRLWLITWHSAPLLPLPPSPPPGGSPTRPGCPESWTDGKEVLSLLFPWSTWGILDYQPTALLPGASLPEELPTIILTCFGQPHVSAPSPLPLPSLGCCSFFPQKDSMELAGQRGAYVSLIGRN